MKTQLLFTGYAPVHFLCFKPIYDQLVRRKDIELFVSGGLRQKVEGGYLYDGEAMYRPIGVAADRILSVDSIQNRNFDMLFSASKRIIAPQQNFATRIQMFHGLSFRNRGVRPENLVYDYFFIIGPYMHRKFAEQGLMAETDPRGIAIGFPKSDPLAHPLPDRSELLKQYGFDDKRPVILYAPTGEALNSLETMGEAVIKRLNRADRYDLIIKPHDHPKNSNIDWFAKLDSLQGPHTKLSRDQDVIPLLMASDLLITDASSVANEYTLLNRPLVYLDVPELIQNSIKNGAALDLQTWGRKGGVLVESADQVVEAIDQQLASPEALSEIRKAIAADLFYNPGSATEAAISWIDNWIQSRQKQAV